MLDMKLIREEPERVREALEKRHMDPSPVDDILLLDEQRRQLIQDVEEMRAERNLVSKEISKIKDQVQRKEKIEAMRHLGDQIDETGNRLKVVEGKLNTLVSELPNIPDPDVPVGVDDSDNIVIRTVGDLPKFDFEPKPHWDLGPELGIIDFERGVKLAGSRFYVLSGAGARLQRALIFWMVDLHIRQGYLEKYPPLMVRGDILFGSGQLPKFKDNLYKDHEEDLWWIPTAEVPLTGLHMDEILDEEQLPLRYTAYTACFRREKVSAGRDVRGIKRGHQFDKVELYTYCLPENSATELERMVSDAEETVALLGMPYRVLLQSTGDLGFGSHKTYDIEVWAPGCGEWLEISSISIVGDFQARRSGIRYRPSDGKNTRFVHTLNGSGLGLPRTLIAVLENYQQADGSVAIPEVLLPLMGGETVIRRES
ncbi:MAG TPA: serine--tRNA ligase [Brevefilum fermentans]|jgi:seryl-tRNA synthetase|uniref:Serine--tRNA ligase n=1 Tax=Candidatus Brevifilum fermentans TaxID=1986204 RepID=A0A1Y6K7X1_9CHLR|nr:serine--tRNA ligase [Brevefilum fermentans]MDI9566418.1 serine--tRNA ligase [Chloroflexota bacterium]OQB82919.1 MAG: Serine--tRNA ligase [Chloroflexi bacterium ADurb.Bin120]SMX54927.1 Serine--tRNA ligase [Brevefilum fermentans]HOM67298.1 serine--tRNA ligase [Brevefilum fermentans]HPX94910.1 serine--tRNA ligase [Brevefilum fermentans]